MRCRCGDSEKGARETHRLVFQLVFSTVPALASVGLTQAAAEEQGIELRVETNDMRNWLSGRTYAETAAWAKVLIDKQTDRIVGAHILGHAGEELIHICAHWR
jgi:glutathione reductase (NADPH)